MSDTETETEEMAPVTSEENISVDVPEVIPAKKKHSRYNVMIKRAISALKAKTGSSRKAIFRYILNNNDVKKRHAFEATLRGLKRMVKSGQLSRSKAGLFKIANREKIKRRLSKGRGRPRSSRNRRKRPAGRKNRKRRKPAKKRRKFGRRR